MTQALRFFRCALAAAVTGLAAASPASADHAVPDDPAPVTDKLTHMGFVEWRKLRWDDGFWKVYDARRENGHVYDLKIEAGTLDLVKLVREKP